MSNLTISQPRFNHALAPTLGVCALLLSTQVVALDKSKGVYRIPYADSTDVKVSNDHLQHSPPGRIDMHGEGGGTYKIVAAADGTVRYVVDSFDKRLDCKKDDGTYIPVSQQKNNFVWIEHANGEWTKYTHMAKGSASGKAKLKVGEFVKAGTYLGDESDVGCESPRVSWRLFGLSHAAKATLGLASCR